MGFSTLITADIGDGGKRSSRDGADVDHFLVHGMASTDFAGTLAMVADPSGRQVSANYFISNEGKIVGCVDESLRAWTSGSPNDGGQGAAWDRRSITVEVENSTGGPEWGFSPAAKEALAQLMADVSRRHRFPLTRTGKTGTVLEHRELWEFWAASYPTACPQSMPTDTVVARANSIITEITKDDDTMHIIKPNSALALKLGVDRRILTDLRHTELVGTASRIASLDFACTRDNGPRYLVYDELNWNKLLALPAFPTGVGGEVVVPTAAEIAAAIETALKDDFAGVIAAIAQVDEATLATFGLKRA